jgi:hypothetical protein
VIDNDAIRFVGSLAELDADAIIGEADRPGEPEGRIPFAGE